MTQAYGQCSLYLHPARHDFAVTDVQPLITALQEISFISAPVNEKDLHSYFTGNRFLDYISYMGCAPTIQFEVSDNSDKFCFVKIHRHETARLIFCEKQSATPHCPHCKKTVKNWRDSKTTTTIRCDQCNTTSNIAAFNWRKMAGFAQLFIEISDIFPKEAIPQQSLLDKLTDITDSEWVYFYSCS